MYNMRIRDLREDHDLMQSDIAALLKTTKQQYSKYELQKQEFPIRHLYTLADYYDVSTDYILGKTNDPTPPKEREKTKEPEKKYSPAVIKAAEDIREMFRKRKGREPNERDLQIIKQFAETFIKGID